MDLNNVPASGNIHLLQGLLRNQLHFKGFVVSDAFAVGSLVTQGFAQDRRDAALRGTAAGVNMDMGSATYLENIKSLLDRGSSPPRNSTVWFDLFSLRSFILGFSNTRMRMPRNRRTPKCLRNIGMQRKTQRHDP